MLQKHGQVQGAELELIRHHFVIQVNLYIFFNILNFLVKKNIYIFEMDKSVFIFTVVCICHFVFILKKFMWHFDHIMYLS